MKYPISFLADGKLFHVPPDGTPTPIESRFGQDLLDEQARMRAKAEWKTRSETGRMLAGALGPGAAAAVRPITISGVTPGFQAREWIYALDMQGVSGLFIHDAADGSERRLFHHNQLALRHLARHPNAEWIAFARPVEDGCSHIGITDPDGKKLDMITEGDAVDEAPSWIPGEESALLFQSAGIGRDAAGAYAGLAPYQIHRIDFKSGTLETIAEDPDHDLLLPRMDADGNLYFVRRPYRKRQSPGILKTLVDVLMLPFRILWAIAAFFNAFSQIFSGKPLYTAGDARRAGPDDRQLLLYGIAMEARKERRGKSKSDEPEALVPDTWKLVRRTPGADESVVAENVGGYALTPDGSVVYTDGSSIYHLQPGGSPERVCRGVRIESLSVQA